MSRIDELLARLAPSGVPFAPLGEVGTLARGRRFTKADYVETGLRAIHYGEIYTTYGLSTTETVSHVQPALRDRLRFAEPGDLIIAATGENAKDVCKAVAWLGSGPVAVHDDCYIFRHELEPMFAAYCFQTASFQRQKEAFVSEAKLSRVAGRDLAQIRIPVPPREVQTEIVRILDSFQELEAELAAELKARRAQSAAVSQRLLFRAAAGGADREVERVRIGDVAKQHVHPVRLDPDEEYACLGVKWYGAGAYLRESKRGAVIKTKTLNRVKAGQFLYNRMFVSEGSFAVVPPELDGGVVSNEFPVYDLDESRILPGWLLLSLLDEYALKRIEAETTGVERGSTKSRRRWKEHLFEGFVIDLPPVAAQRRVLHVLGVLNALQEALEDELRTRRQQYEHYRDRLLTFREA